MDRQARSRTGRGYRPVRGGKPDRSGECTLLVESLDLLSYQDGKAESVRVTGFMGSKCLILGWIESHVPKDAESILFGW